MYDELNNQENPVNEPVVPPEEETEDTLVEEFPFTPPEDEGSLTEEELLAAESLENELLASAKGAAAAGMWQKELFEWTQSIAIALVIAFLINHFLFSVVRVEGPSMENTLHGNERLIVTKLNYKPAFQDIVIIRPTTRENRYLVKRVIGLPGQTIDLVNDQLYVDGERINEPYIRPANRQAGDVTFPLTVEEGHVFVMGDNRGNSLDSRFTSIGQIPFDHIYGKAVYRIWPFNKLGTLYDDIK